MASCVISLEVSEVPTSPPAVTSELACAGGGLTPATSFSGLIQRGAVSGDSFLRLFPEVGMCRRGGCHGTRCQGPWRPAEDVALGADLLPSAEGAERSDSAPCAGRVVCLCVLSRCNSGGTGGAAGGSFRAGSLRLHSLFSGFWGCTGHGLEPLAGASRCWRGTSLFHAFPCSCSWGRRPVKLSKRGIV